jgi:hypothetical protein
MEKMETQLSFAVFGPSKIQVPCSRLRSAKGFPFEFKMGRKLVQKMGSSTEGSKNPTTQTNTPKSVEEVVREVMQA